MVGCGFEEAERFVVQDGLGAARHNGSGSAVPTGVPLLLDFPLDFREEIGERCVVQLDAFAALECFDSDPDFVLEICESFALPLEQSRPLR